MKALPYSHHYFLVGQLALGLCLLVCFIIIPDYFFSVDQGGVSNYGTDERTIVLFSIGFGAATAGALIAASKLLNKRGLEKIKYQLLALSLFYSLVLLSTYFYKISSFYENLHILVSFGLSILMTTFVISISRNNWDDNYIRRMFKLYCLGFSVALATLFGFADLLFTAQILCGLSFGAIMTRHIYFINVLS